MTKITFVGFVLAGLMLTGCQPAKLGAKAPDAPAAPAYTPGPGPAPVPPPPPRFGEREPIDTTIPPTPIVITPPPVQPPPPVTPPPRPSFPEPRDPVVPPPPPTVTPQPTTPAPTPIVTPRNPPPQPPPVQQPPPTPVVTPQPTQPQPVQPPPTPVVTTPPPQPQPVQPPPTPVVTPQPPQPQPVQPPPTPVVTTPPPQPVQPPPTPVVSTPQLPAIGPIPPKRPLDISQPSTEPSPAPAPIPVPAQKPEPPVTQLPVNPPLPVPRPVAPKVDPIPGQCRILPATTVKTVSTPDKLDVLFVVDASPSLVRGGKQGPELAKLASEMDSFVKNLPKGTDYRIGVIAAHGPESPHHGKLIGSVLDSQKMSTQQMWKALRNTMTKIPADKAPGAKYLSDSQGEAMLLSLFTAITNPERREAIEKAGLFRKEGNLAVIIVSDEQDICWNYPGDVSGYNKADEQLFADGRVPVLKLAKDGKSLTADPKEIAAKRFCKISEGDSKSPDDRGGVYLDHQKLAAKLAAFESVYKSKVIMNAIAYTSNATLKPVMTDQDENEMGHGIIDLVDYMKTGKVADMAEVRRGGGLSFADALSQLGTTTSVQLRTTTVWDCSTKEIHMGAIDPETVEVTVMEATATEIQGFKQGGELSDSGQVIARFSAACQPGHPCQSADGALKVEQRSSKKGTYMKVSPADPVAFDRLMKERNIQAAKFKIQFKTLRDYNPRTGKPTQIGEVIEPLTSMAATGPSGNPLQDAVDAAGPKPKARPVVQRPGQPRPDLEAKAKPASTPKKTAEAAPKAKPAVKPAAKTANGKPVITTELPVPGSKKGS